ncbi:MAG: GNAT family N-acetyltransferase [Dermatophilaceae bacterium]
MSSQDQRPPESTPPRTLGVTPTGALLSWPDTQPVLTDGTVTLRAWSPSDLEAVFLACQDPDIQRWLPIPVPYLREHAATFINDVAPQQWAAQQAVLFAITSTATAKLLGSCGVSTIQHRDMVGHVGYWVAPWARGRKVAQQALRLLSHWAFSAGGLARLEFLIDPRNTTSVTVARALGCKKEGILRSRLLIHGTRTDMALYALLPDERHLR